MYIFYSLILQLILIHIGGTPVTVYIEDLSYTPEHSLRTPGKADEQGNNETQAKTPSP